MRWSILTVILLSLLLAGCSSGKEPAASPTASAVVPAPAASSTRETSPNSPAGSERVPLTVWLTDVATARTSTLVQDYDWAGWWPFFGASAFEAFVVSLLPSSLEAIKFGLNGAELRRGPPEVFCPNSIPGKRYPSRSFEEVICLRSAPNLSPGGRWSLYEVGGTGSLEYALWAEDTRSGERFLVQDGLRHCGGCDGRFGNIWSPSGRYLVLAETGGEGRVFLSDLERRSTRFLTNGSQISDAPRWSPIEDILLWKSGSDLVMREDPAAGTLQEFAHLNWPARFDMFGQVIYTPAFMQGNPEKNPAFKPETIVAKGATAEVVVVLSGAPPFLHLLRDAEAVLSSPRGIISALELAEGCKGTAVYVNGTRTACAVSSVGATISPDGSKIALARVTGTTGIIAFPGGGAVGLPKYDVVILEVETGRETVVAQGAVGDQPPEFLWNATSSHLLIRWPILGGL